MYYVSLIWRRDARDRMQRPDKNINPMLVTFEERK